MTPLLQQNQRIYGLSENNDYYCLVERTPQEFFIHWQAKSSSLFLPLTETAYLIKAIPFHLIWRRVLFFPKSYTQVLLYQQIIQKMVQELPIDITDLHFDYKIQSLDNSWRVAIFAIRKNAIQPLMPENKSIFDCELHCIARALCYLNHIPFEQITQYSYPIGNKFFTFHSDGILISETVPENSLLLIDNTQTSPVEILDYSLYLKALGAALWNGTALI